jgi:hypothetical protein
MRRHSILGHGGVALVFLDQLLRKLLQYKAPTPGMVMRLAADRILFRLVDNHTINIKLQHRSSRTIHLRIESLAL